MYFDIYLDINIQSIWTSQSSKYSKFPFFVVFLVFCGKAEHRECGVQEKKPVRLASRNTTTNKLVKIRIYFIEKKCSFCE